MAVIHTYLTCELQKLLKVQYLDGNLFSQDNQANEFHVIVLDNGEPAEISGTVTADVIRSDGGTVAVTGGTIEGNVASITFNAAVYAIPGVVSIVVKLTTSGVVTTIAAAVTNVYQSSTSVTVDPGTIIPSIQTLISSIETAVASIPADYSSLWTSLAPAFSSSASYVAGQYCTYNGAVYRFNTSHSGSWAAGDVTAVNIGGELTALKSAIDVVCETEETPNILTEAYVPGSINSSGGDGTSDSYKRTDYQPIVPGTTLYAIRTSQPYYTKIFFYTSNDATTYISDSGTIIFQANATALTNFTGISVPETAAYFRLSLGATATGGLELSYTQPSEYQPKGESVSGLKDGIVTLNSIDDDVKSRLNGILYGKNVVCLGDSIFGNFYGDSGNGKYENGIGICNILAKKSGATVRNCAFGGSRMAYETSAYGDADPAELGAFPSDHTVDTVANKNFNLYKAWNALSGAYIADQIVSGNWDQADKAVEWISSDIIVDEDTYSGNAIAKHYFTERLAALKAVDWSAVDFVLWEYGTNDFSTNVALSDPSDTTNLYAYDNAYRHAIETIQEAYPHIRIIPITPMWRWYRDTSTNAFIEDSNTHEEKDYAGGWSKLPDFVNKVFEISNEYQLQCIDDYYSLGANRNSYLDYFDNTEGVHPNASGRMKIADHIFGMINAGASTLLPQNADKTIMQTVDSWYKNNFPDGENIVPLSSCRIHQRGVLHEDYQYTGGEKKAYLLMPTMTNGDPIKKGTVVFDLSTAVSMIGVQKINLRMYIENVNKISTCTFRVTTSNSISLDYGISNKISEGWNDILINVNNQTYENIQNWSDAASFRLIFFGNGTDDYKVYISGIILGRIEKAKLIFVDDHAYHGFMERAYPLLKAAGQPVTWAINPGDLGGVVGDGESKLTQEDIDTLAMDAYSEFSFHNWNPKNNPTETMTADELRQDYQKCITYLRQHGICPTHIWRAALTQNRADNWWVAQDMVEAAAMHNASGGFVTWPFDDPYNVQRVSLHRGKVNDQYEDFETQFKPRIDGYFNRLQKTHGTMILYTHGCIENRASATTDLHCTVEEVQYLSSKIAAAVAAGWLEPTTYNRLRVMQEHGMYSMPDYE